jgi:aminomethyltransferase
MEERGIPRQHYRICDESGTEIGNVTSGTQSPMLGQGIGMGYVLKEFSLPDTPIWIEIRSKMILARVKKFPLVDLKK